MQSDTIGVIKEDTNTLENPALLKPSAKVDRVTVRLTGDLGESVRRVQKTTLASNPSEVVRKALAVYITLVEQKLKGNEPVVLIAGEKRKVPIFL